MGRYVTLEGASCDTELFLKARCHLRIPYGHAKLISHVPSKNQIVQIKSNQIKSNQIKSNQIKSNQIKSNQIKSNQIKSNQIKSNQIKSNQIKLN